MIVAPKEVAICDASSQSYDLKNQLAIHIYFSNLIEFKLQSSMGDG